MFPERLPEFINPQKPNSKQNEIDSHRNRLSGLFEAENDNNSNDAIEAGRHFRKATEILRASNVVQARRTIRNRFRGMPS